MADNLVYIVGNKENRICKIGVSSFASFDGRLSHIQNGCPYKLEVFVAVCVSSRDKAFTLEKRLHRIFKESRLNGEWFRVTQDMACLVDLLIRKSRLYEGVGFAVAEEYNLSDLEKFVSRSPWAENKNRENDAEFWKSICYELRKQLISLNSRIEIITSAVGLAAEQTESLRKSAAMESMWLSHGVFDLGQSDMFGEAMDMKVEMQDVVDGAIKKFSLAYQIAEDMLDAES